MSVEYGRVGGARKISGPRGTVGGSCPVRGGGLSDVLRGGIEPLSHSSIVFTLCSLTIV